MSKERDRSKEFPLIRPTPLSVAISVVLAAPAATAVAQDQSDTDGGFTLEEVLVTARKRTENLQMIPESIQAISEQQMEKAGIFSMDDYVRFIPSLSIVGSNPGSAKIVFRGIADDAATFIAEPSAALYLDEQSLTLNATPDPRMVDIERVEALSGPQGTLYGASAQSGVLRVVTNKPDPSAFDANVDIMFKGMSEGDASYDVSAMINLPISDTFAVRLVGFSARDGGFIDNVLGTTPRFELFDNADVVEDDFNDVDYVGGRISARWLLNDNWTVTAGFIHQDTDSKGRPEHDPAFAGELNVIRFKPDFEYDRQDWTQYSLTIEGDLGFAEFVSATSYFTRDWEYTQDTSVGYASYFGTFCYSGYYYNWSVYARYCFQPAGVGNYYNDPIGYLENTQKNTKFAQEFRLFHKGDTADWIVGFFYEDAHEDWQFTTFTDGYEQSKSLQNFFDGNLIGRGNPIPTQSPGNAWWFSADDTDFEQWAVFGEFTWHVTEKLDATFGARYFERTMDKTYHVELPRFNITDDGFSNPSSDDSDWVPKASVSYQINDDSMVYALYSEGFRPGGTNRNRGLTFFPVQFESDILKNSEIGTKNTFMDGRLRLNATYFDMSWNDYQIEAVDPSNIPCGTANAQPPPLCGQPWQKVVANVGNASSKGLEVQLDFAATQNFTFGGNATWLDAVLDDDVFITTEVPAGSRLPLSPEFKGSAYAQLNWPVDWFGGHNAWARLQWSHTGSVLNMVEPLTLDDGPAPQITSPAYDIGDFRVGLDSDNWSVQLFVLNLTDERADLFANPFDFDNFFGRSRVTVNRPREFGIRWIQRFGK